MTSTYNEIKAQIAALQTQAEEIRRNEIKSVISELKSKIAEYGITAQQLGFVAGAPATSTSISVARNPVAAKYASADGQNKWTGRGIAPKWVQDHIASGGSKEDLLIK